MIYFLLICLFLTSFFSPYWTVPWLVLIVLYMIQKENIRLRQERKVFNKLEIALNKPIIV